MSLWVRQCQAKFLVDKILCQTKFWSYQFLSLSSNNIFCWMKNFVLFWKFEFILRAQLFITLFPFVNFVYLRLFLLVLQVFSISVEAFSSLWLVKNLLLVCWLHLFLSSGQLGGISTFCQSISRNKSWWQLALYSWSYL